MAVVIVGMQNGDFIGFIFFIGLHGQANQTQAAISASATLRFINFIFSP